MADKPKTNVDKFFELYDADPALQARVQQAMDCYPGSLEIRDVMTEHVLLPVAEELGLPFTLKELRKVGPPAPGPRADGRRDGGG